MNDLLLPGKAAREVKESCTNGKKKDKMRVQDILSVDYIHIYPHCAIGERLSETVSSPVAQTLNSFEYSFRRIQDEDQSTMNKLT